MQDSIQDLWTNIKNGDKKAFETLFFKFYNPLCLYASGFIKNEEVVKEIVSDVFLKIWQKRQDIVIMQGLKPYLYRCVHNASLDYLKTEKNSGKHPFIEITRKIEEMIGLDDDYIIEQMSFPDVEKDVMEAINSLPPKCKEIFYLCRFELLTYNQISERLNISVNTVKTQISRSLDSLRPLLKKYL